MPQMQIWGALDLLLLFVMWAVMMVAMMVNTSSILGGLLLIAAGIFQWTPLKQAGLVNCRSPLGFLMSEWREGKLGAFLMGLEHGTYCAGCCWFLMALLFVAGVMNLLWVATITAFVLVEKVIPRGDLVGRVAGGVLVLAGIVVIAGG